MVVFQLMDTLKLLKSHLTSNYQDIGIRANDVILHISELHSHQKLVIITNMGRLIAL